MAGPWKRVGTIARNQRALIRIDQLDAAGVTPGARARALATGWIERVQPGVYRMAGAPPSWESDVLAAVLAAGRAGYASHRAAARIWGYVDLSDVDLTVPPGHRPRLHGVTLHRSTDLARNHVTRRSKIPVTNPMRTLVDLGAVRPDLVPDAIEMALISKVASHLGIERALEDVARRGRRGAGVLRAAMDDRALGKDRPDSLLEVRMARLMRERKLPPAVYQHRVPVPGRTHPLRIDFAYPDLKLAIEVDGFRWHGTSRAQERDAERDAQLRALGWTVLHFTWNAVVRRPGWVASQVRAAIDAAVAAAA